MEEFMNMEQIEKVIENAKGHISEGRRYIAEFNDAILTIELEDGELKVDVFQGHSVKYDGDLLKI